MYQSLIDVELPYLDFINRLITYFAQIETFIPYNP